MTTKGPGLMALGDALLAGREEIVRRLGQVEADAIRARAFGAGGLDSNGRPLPNGRDLVRTGALRRGLGVLQVEADTAYIGVAGPAAEYADRVNRQVPFLKPTDADLAKVGAAAPEIIRDVLARALGPSS